jgi:hypothetical protein
MAGFAVIVAYGGGYFAAGADLRVEQAGHAAQVRVLEQRVERLTAQRDLCWEAYDQIGR